jgi:hypothetical protein
VKEVTLNVIELNHLLIHTAASAWWFQVAPVFATVSTVSFDTLPEGA